MLTGVTTIGYTETRKIEYFDNNAGFEGLNQLAKLMQLFALNYVTAKLYKNMRTFLEMVHGSVSSAWTIQNSQKLVQIIRQIPGAVKLGSMIVSNWPLELD